jgi:hypothetical protein
MINIVACLPESPPEAAVEESSSPDLL